MVPGTVHESQEDTAEAGKSDQNQLFLRFPRAATDCFASGLLSSVCQHRLKPLGISTQAPQAAVLAIETASRSRFNPQTKKRLQRGKLTSLFQDAWQGKIFALKLFGETGPIKSHVGRSVHPATRGNAVAARVKGDFNRDKSKRFIVAVPKR